MTDFEKLLRAGIVWRDARRASLANMTDSRAMNGYTKACSALEKTVNEMAPVDQITRPMPLEEALERSLASNASHATYADDPCTICSSFGREACGTPTIFGNRPKEKRRRHG